MRAKISSMNEKKSIEVIGVGLDLGAESLGVSDGPAVFRRLNILDKLSGAGLEVTDSGDVDCPDRSTLVPGDPMIPYADEIVRVNEALANLVGESIKADKVPVVLGGDHSVNLGAFAGAADALDGKIGLIYIDAHGDINTPETSASHNIHGMHLASLMGFGPDVLVDAYRPGRKLAQENLLHVAGSDFDLGEKELIRAQNLRCFTMFDLLMNGMSPLIQMIDELRARVPNIWVSVDLDAIDSTYAPGVGIPSRGGLTYREIAAITEYIGTKCNVVGMDIVEYNPNFDIDDKTGELAIEIIAKLLGTNYSWYTQYMSCLARQLIEGPKLYTKLM